jgi:hypothetical protein
MNFVLFASSSASSRFYGGNCGENLVLPDNLNSTPQIEVMLAQIRNSHGVYNVQEHRGSIEFAFNCCSEVQSLAIHACGRSQETSSLLFPFPPSHLLNVLVTFLCTRGCNDSGSLDPERRALYHKVESRLVRRERFEAH